MGARVPPIRKIRRLGQLQGRNGTFGDVEPGPTCYAKTVDGLNIAYRVGGEGPPLLGIGDWWGHVERDWDLPPLKRFWSRLGSFTRLITYDIRGCSLSDPLPEEQPPVLEQCLDDIIAVLDATGEERAAVFACAAAAQLGIMFAASKPDRVSSLIIYNGYAQFCQSEDQPFGMPIESYGPFKEMVVAHWGTEEVARVAASGLEWTPEMSQAAAANLRYTASPATAERLLPLLYENDVRGVVPPHGVPTLVMHSADNPLVPLEHGRALAASIPGAKLVEIPGEDHAFWGTAADAICDEIQEFLTGARGAPETDRVLTTVLFSDVVRSTDLVARLGDRRWRDFLERHEEMTSIALADYRGREVRTTGDGILATFDGPARAIHCGIRLRDEARRMGCRVRVGIHTGEVELRGRDIGGIAVHIAARVQAIAEPDEVLVSSTVVDLVAGSDIDFEDRGEHVLKGIPGTRRIFAAKSRHT